MPAWPRTENGVGSTTGNPEVSTQIPLDKYSLVNGVRREDDERARRIRPSSV